MKKKTVLSVLGSFLIGLTAGWAQAEDIDLFASDLSLGNAADTRPNVIFVIDNTSNWSRQSQQWPGDDTQGQSEILAIKNTLEALPDDIDLNVGIIVYTTGGSANVDGAYVRFDLQSYQDNSVAFSTTLDTIYDNIESPLEKRNSNSSYGNLFYDVYNYLSGTAQSFAGEGTPTTLVDDAAYTSTYDTFASPLTVDDLCTQTYLILISNPDSNGPESDTSTNSDALAALYANYGASPPASLAGAASGGLSMPEYQTTRTNQTSSNQDDLGYTQQCYASTNACDTGIVGATDETALIMETCVDSSVGCFCSTAANQRSNRDPDGDRCASGSYSYNVFAPTAGSGSMGHDPTGGTVDGVDYNLDDWTKFLKEFGVEVTVPGEGDAADETYRVQATTYTVDVYNAQPSEVHSSLMDSAAEQGGGYRQSATNAAELQAALTRIFGDVLDVNTSFAAVTLPLSATNRAQADNRVFVGMFRPATLRKPRWLGNLKQYQLAVFNGQVELADVNYDRAINPQTGFAQSCATSFWTEDTTDVDPSTAGDQPYFEALALDPSPVSECAASVRDGRSVLSDSPDGPFVEKGGAAQQIRGQVDGAGSSSRTILTEAGSGLRAITVDDFSVVSYLDYLKGEDPGLKGGDYKVNDGAGNYIINPNLGEPEVMPSEGLRATIHGDVIHSRPLTVSYGPHPSGVGTEFRIFYGANDGLYRAVDPDTGTEDWAFIASEQWSQIERQYRNTPTIDYFGLDPSISSLIDASPKDYFMDGSTGSFFTYNSDNQLTTGYIYPTMRRGGRMVYGFDISPDSGSPGVPPAAPDLLWKAGCPSRQSDTGCVSGYDNMGDTWSTPVVGFVEGYGGGASSGASPVLFMGGGWDDCLDDDTATFPTTCSKGNSVFAIDATNGTKLAEFATDDPVVAEVTPLDLDGDGNVDFVYAADAGGNLYRISVSSLVSGTATGTTSLASGDWFIDKIAASSSSQVRFMNKPVVGELGTLVFVTIGSGDRERPLKVNYPYASDVDNRFYVFIDRPYPYDEDGNGVLSASEADIQSRAARNLDSTTTMVDASQGLSAGQSLVDFDGWYMDLSDRGEQVVNQSAIGGGKVFFNTFQPGGQAAGLCTSLGTSKAYSIPLFAPEDDPGTAFGEGIPIPPIIVTVNLASQDPSCTGDGCGEGEMPDEVVTVCIGCQGFDPIEITPSTDLNLKEAFQVENMDAL